MKSKMCSIIVCGILLISALCISCTSDEEACHDQGDLYCEGDDGCCASSVPWSDGHGTCYNSQSYCTASGWPCIRCW
jgi:hypothetical protein